MSQREAAPKLNISQPTLAKVLKQKEQIEFETVQNISQSRKRKRGGKDPDVEFALKEWFVKIRDKDARVSGPLLCQKAQELAKKWEKMIWRLQMVGSIGGKKERIFSMVKLMESRVMLMLKEQSAGWKRNGFHSLLSIHHAMCSMLMKQLFITELCLNIRMQLKMIK